MRTLSISARRVRKPQARVRVRLPVTVEGDDTNGREFSEPTVVENVTRRGAFVATARPLEPGNLVAVRASGPGSRLCFAQVVWVRSEPSGSSGVGIRIVNDNSRWMNYLIEHSVRALDVEPASVE